MQTLTREDLEKKILDQKSRLELTNILTDLGLLISIKTSEIVDSHDTEKTINGKIDSAGIFTYSKQLPKQMHIYVDIDGNAGYAKVIDYTINNNDIIFTNSDFFNKRLYIELY